MNQRQLKKREKRQNNAYWDQFEEMIQAEEVMLQAKRMDGIGRQEYGECAILFFQVESLDNWQFIAQIKDSNELSLYWMEEFQLETCFFQWTGLSEEFKVADWVKWVKPLKQSSLKAFVQAITGKKRLSEKQAEEWWQQYQKTEKEALEQDESVLREVKDYVRTLPYQLPDISKALVLEPVQVRVEKEWKTIPVYQLPIQVLFKEGTSEEKQKGLKEQIRIALKDEIYQSRSYEIELI